MGGLTHAKLLELDRNSLSLMLRRFRTCRLPTEEL